MEQSDLLSAILDIGQSMLEAGAEVSRVETTIQLLCRAYGFQHINVFTISFSIVVSVRTAEGQILTQTRRVNRQRNNLHCIEQFNALSRRLCRTPAPAEDVRAEVERIRSAPAYPDWLRFLLYLVIPLAMTLFLGGSLRDGLASSACAAVLWAADRTGQRLGVKDLVHCFFCAVTVGLCAVGLAVLLPALDLNMVIIGNILLLIPGLALTVSLRDMINGDIITGLLGFSDALLRALIIAIGVALPTLLGGGF